MRLSDDQIRRFEEEGYLFLPALFAADEIAVLRDALPAVLAQRRPEIVRERSGEAVRTAFAVHTYSEPFARLARHPRLMAPAAALLGGPVYIHQFKVNAKAAFDGDLWQWHQDYGTWAVDDGMPEPRAMNLAIFLDEVTEFNGPLMFIPGSQNSGRIEAGYDRSTTSYPLWTIDNDTVRELAEANGIVAPKGPAGSAVLFHCNLVHCSPSNLSPWPRRIVYLTANRTDNAIRTPTRPEHIAHTDFTPIAPLDDDCLRRPAPAAQAAG